MHYRTFMIVLWHQINNKRWVNAAISNQCIDMISKFKKIPLNAIVLQGEGKRTD